MANELGMMFGASSNNVNVNRQGSDREQYNIKSIAAGRSDMQAVADGLNGILKAAPQIASSLDNMEKAEQRAKKASNIVIAKKDWLDFTEQDTYMNGTATVKADMLDSFRNSLNDKPQEYIDTMITYSHADFTKYNIGREEEKNNAYYSSIGDQQNVWENEPVAGEGKIDNSNNPTNATYYGDKVSEAFATTLQKEHPSMRMADIRNAQLHFNQESKLSKIRSASNTKDLLEIRAENQEIDKKFNTNIYNNNQSPLVQQQVAKDAAEEARVIKVMENKFKQDALNTIGRIADKNNPNVFKKYLDYAKPSVFFDAYGDGAEGPMREFNQNVDIYEDARTKGTAFIANIATKTNWSGETKETKEGYQYILDQTIVNRISTTGSIDDITSDIIINQGAIDNKRLKTLHDSMIEGISSDNPNIMLGLLNKIQKNKGAVLKAIFPDSKERNKILALQPLSLVHNKSIQETWDYLQTAPSIQPQKLTRNESATLSDLLHDDDIPASFKQELQVSYNAMASYGVSHDKIMDALEEYKDTEPYSIDTALTGQTGDVKDIIIEELDSITPKDNKTFYDIDINSIVFEDVFGFNTSIDKDKFVEASTTISKIKKYNKEHYIKRGFEGFADSGSTVIGDVTNYSKSYIQNSIIYGQNSLDALVHLGKSALSDEVSMEDWKPPLEYKKYLTAKGIDLKNKEAVTQEILKAVSNVNNMRGLESIVANMMSNNPDLTVDDAVSNASNLLTNVKELYPDAGDPIQLIKELTNQTNLVPMKVSKEDRSNLEGVHNSKVRSKKRLLETLNSYMKE